MKVFVTRQLPGDALAQLGQDFEVTVDEKPYSPERIKEAAKGYDALICQLNHRVDRSVIRSLAPELKVIANYAVGYDNIDVAAADEYGIYVTNTPDVLTNATAEIAWALMFACARRVCEGDAFTRQGLFTGWQPDLLLGRDICEKTLGVVGAGRIGARVLRMARGFDMRLLYHNRRRDERLEKETGAVYVPFERLLEESDFISINCPLTEQTRHLIGAEAFARMKRTAVLVNTARGAVIEESALVEALEQKRIFACGLDVYEFEPEVSGRLKTLSNCVILPHIGSATVETRARMAYLAAQDVRLVLEGKKPIHSINEIDF